MPARLNKTQQKITSSPFSNRTDSLPISLMRAREAVMGYFRPKHRKQGMTDPQWRVLRVLNRDGSLEVTELANRAVLMTPSLSRILKDFEKQGMISRQGVDGDLRRSLVSITKAGVKRLAFGEQEVNEIYDEILARYGRKRMELLLQLLKELEDVLSNPETD